MMASLEVSSLDGGALQLQSQLWATNSVLIDGGDACAVCDPSIFPEEIDAIRDKTASYGRVYLLVTHSDFDHVCGVPSFPDATVIAGARTATAIADGTARRKLDQGVLGWGGSWAGELRVDVVAGDEVLGCGELDLVVFEAHGHAADGSAFVVTNRRLLLPGDYLSAVCYPIVLGSLDAVIATHERLLAALDAYEVLLIVPGHGPALNRREAQRIAREDLRYIRALQAAAGDAVHDDLSADAALLAVRGVQPPRPARPDFEALDLRSANARTALTEAGHEGFPVAQT